MKKIVAKKKFINRNNAFEKSQYYHDKRSSDNYGGKNSNILTSDYHIEVYTWQARNKMIMPKWMRKRVYQKAVLDKI